MSVGGRTLIVMPAFNEAESITSILNEVLTLLPEHGCLVVDDGSSDTTAEIARRAGVRVAQLPFNLGVGGAMRLGFKYALANGYENVVQIDSDGQHDPAEVPKLLAALAGADIAIGARFAGVGGYRVRGLRKWAMRILSTVLSRAARTRLTDTTSGFKACGPRAVQLFAEHLPAEYLGDTIEALVIALRNGCTVTQVPVEMRVRLAGTPSHGPVKSAVYLARAVVALFVAFVRSGDRRVAQEATL